MNTLVAYFKLVRPLNVVIGMLGVILGGYLTGELALGKVFWLALITVVAYTGGANAINDYYDYDIDLINRPDRPLPRGLIRRASARIFAYALFVTGLLAAWFIGWLPFGIALGSVLLLVGYSMWWKRQPVIGNFVVALMVGVAFLFGAAAFGDPVAAWPPVFIGGIYTWAREIIKDLQDLEGDAATEARTLPLVWGVIPAKWLTTLLLVLLMAGVVVPYGLKIYNIYYFLMVLVGVNAPILYITIQLWRARSSSDYQFLSHILKADMFVGLFAVFVGTF